MVFLGFPEHRPSLMTEAAPQLWITHEGPSMFQQRHALAVMQRSTQISFLLFFTVLLIIASMTGHVSTHGAFRSLRSSVV